MRGLTDKKDEERLVVAAFNNFEIFLTKNSSNFNERSICQMLNKMEFKTITL